MSWLPCTGPLPVHVVEFLLHSLWDDESEGFCCPSPCPAYKHLAGNWNREPCPAAVSWIEERLRACESGMKRPSSNKQMQLVASRLYFVLLHGTPCNRQRRACSILPHSISNQQQLSNTHKLIRVISSVRWPFESEKKCQALCA